MADGSKIEWTDATWNPITGCSVVSPGCTNCYAMKLAGGRLRHHSSRSGLTDDTRAGPVWNGKVTFNLEWMQQPLQWTRPRKVFVCAHGDLFHEAIPDKWIDHVFAAMVLAPQHTFQVLTKRAARMRAYLDGLICDNGWRPYIRRAGNSILLLQENQTWPLRNVWLGVSCEDQARTDERIPDLLRTPAAVRFVSAEPLLGPLDLRGIHFMDGDAKIKLDALNGEAWVENSESASAYTNADDGNTHLDWVITGGESGPGARPSNPQWFRDIRDQCVAAGVAYFHKQNGEWVSVSEVEGDGPHFTFPDGRTVRRAGKKCAGRLLDGRTWDQIPERAGNG